uniref:Uncharacterized protein n=1 Tax=Ralstonia solanacearum TaxID=305 RepID=A0A0S4X135_RALSL|nr:protein of unknown function [Ralstonia solanacearum]
MNVCVIPPSIGRPFLAHHPRHLQPLLSQRLRDS